MNDEKPTMDKLTDAIVSAAETVKNVVETAMPAAPETVVSKPVQRKRTARKLKRKEKVARKKSPARKKARKVRKSGAKTAAKKKTRKAARKKRR
ncbi:MAG TPA: hypothetical protein VFL51_15100 [Pseudolabrys sp.]|nr:hypothetical protein [Pseudolabrys sp.]